MSTLGPQYRIQHVGLNHPDEASAWDTARKLCDLFDLQPENETETRVFAGTLFEVKKNCSRGKYGHIALQTDDIEMAIEHLARKGVRILEDTIRYNEEGKIKFVFLDAEISGFAFHLTL